MSFKVLGVQIELQVRLLKLCTLVHEASKHILSEAADAQSGNPGINNRRVEVSIGFKQTAPSFA